MENNFNATYNIEYFSELIWLLNNFDTLFK